jgi:phosphodiester glycosidase
MPEGAVYTLRRDRLADGAWTTVYIVRYPRDGLRAQVRIFRQPRRLDHWCHKHAVQEAVVGGFYRREPFRPLGDVWIDGRQVAGEAFPPRFAGVRPALDSDDAGLRIRRRETLPDDPPGSRLQAGPLLVEDGRVVFDEASDTEGFRSASDQFDSDITEGRHPRAAIGLGPDHVTVLACDGRRSRVDAGLTMLELAGTMQALGCEAAMNLDGGGSTTLVHRGHLLNRPYTDQDQPAPASRPIVCALLLSAPLS